MLAYGVSQSADAGRRRFADGAAAAVEPGASGARPALTWLNEGRMKLEAKRNVLHDGLIVHASLRGQVGEPRDLLRHPLRGMLSAVARSIVSRTRRQTPPGGMAYTRRAGHGRGESASVPLQVAVRRPGIMIFGQGCLRGCFDKRLLSPCVILLCPAYSK